MPRNSYLNNMLHLKMKYVLIFGLNLLMFFQTFINAASLPTQSGTKCDSFCNTTVCVQQAEFLKKFMDPTVNPCDDFYQFVCGNYVKNVPIPEDQPGISHINVIQDRIRDQLISDLNKPTQPSDLKAFKNVKMHFQNCLNGSGIETVGTAPLLELINKLGGWPVLQGDNWKEEDYKWENTVSEISQQGFNPDFPTKFSVSYSTKKSNYIFQVNPAATNIDESYFAPESFSLEAYEYLLIETAVLLGATREKATSEMKECFGFEIELHKIKMSSAELDALTPEVNVRSLKKLSEIHFDMPWLDVFNRILNPSGVTIHDEELFNVVDPQYLFKIGELIKKTPKRVLANYQIWKVIYSLIDYLPRSFRNLKFNFQQGTVGLEEESERANVCYTLLQTTFSTALGSMHVRNHFNRRSKEAVTEILRRIREELKQVINKVEWMDENTRKSAIEKLQAMQSDVAFPDELLADQEIENHYKDLKIESGNFFEDYCKIAKHSKDFMLNVPSRPLYETDWTFEADVAIANAFYAPERNKIVIVAGILQEPYFKFMRPEYLNFGGIGYTVGHEITHGFDSMGRKYDKDGKYENWWDNNTANEFENKVQCLVDQYNDYFVYQIHEQLDGDLTKDENIADAGGIKLAYHAYQNFVKSRGRSEECLANLNYSPQQMFWINAGNIWCSKFTDDVLEFLLTDPHSPGEARANVVFSNIREFADDFNCPVGSKMNPAKKCTVW